jgi:hypothetical protein
MYKFEFQGEAGDQSFSAVLADNTFLLVLMTFGFGISKKAFWKIDIHDWYTACGNFRHQVM